MHKISNQKVYFFLIGLISMLIYACAPNSSKKMELLSNTLEGTWGVENSSLTEIWSRRNNDSLCAISYFFKDNGDSVFLSTSSIYKSKDKIFLDILNKNNKLKLYYLKEIDKDYFVFNAISEEFYPTSIHYKIRKEKDKNLESFVDGKVNGKYQSYQFKMYKVY